MCFFLVLLKSERGSALGAAAIGVSHSRTFLPFCQPCLHKRGGREKVDYGSLTLPTGFASPLNQCYTPAKPVFQTEGREIYYFYCPSLNPGTCTCFGYITGHFWAPVFFLIFCQLHEESMLKDMDKVGASLVFLGKGYVKIASRSVLAPWRRELRHTATFTDALWRQGQPKAHEA